MPLRLKDTLSKIFPAASAVPTAQAPASRREDTRRPSYQTALVEWQDVERGAQALAGRVENRSKRGLGLRIPRPIAQGKTVTITPESETPIRGVVQRCASEGEGWFIGVKLVAREKRRSDREPMRLAANVTCTRSGRRSDFPIVIEDANENGLQIESSEELTVDQRIEISHLGVSREAIVAYCRPEGERYRVGVQFIGRLHGDEPPIKEGQD